MTQQRWVETKAGDYRQRGSVAITDSSVSSDQRAAQKRKSDPCALRSKTKYNADQEALPAIVFNILLDVQWHSLALYRGA
jgi:hypothetical protein